MGQVAIMEIKKGERPYKIIDTGFLPGGFLQRRLRFVLLSKKMKNGKIGWVTYTQREGKEKIPQFSGQIKETRFMDVVQAHRQVVQQMYPDADLRLEDFQELQEKDRVVAKKLLEKK